MEKPLGVRVPTRGWVEDDWRATPSTGRPWPVILIHGTSARTGDFQDLAAQLRQLGWAVFVPTYGNRATGPIEDSADQVRAYIEAVLHATDAEKVIIVGHSQGGLLARYYIKNLGGDKTVKHLITLSTPHHGTSLGGMLSVLAQSPRGAGIMRTMIDNYFGPAGMQHIAGSDFLTQLNDTAPTKGPGYTCLATRTDSTVVPAESSFLDGADNAWVQDYHPLAVVLHEDMPRDRRVRDLVTSAIEQLKPVQ